MFIAEGLYKRLNKNESFANLAKEFSDDKSTSDLGGYIGINNKKGIFKELINVLEKLEYGVHSKPFKTDFGWHILRKEKITNKDILDLERDKYFQKERKIISNQIRKNAKIKRYEKYNNK